jgi:hypothetical protein
MPESRYAPSVTVTHDDNGTVTAVHVDWCESGLMVDQLDGVDEETAEKLAGHFDTWIKTRPDLDGDLYVATADDAELHALLAGLPHGEHRARRLVLSWFTDQLSVAVGAPVTGWFAYADEGAGAFWPFEIHTADGIVTEDTNTVLARLPLIQEYSDETDGTDTDDLLGVFCDAQFDDERLGFLCDYARMCANDRGIFEG